MVITRTFRLRFSSVRRFVSPALTPNRRIAPTARQRRDERTSHRYMSFSPTRRSGAFGSSKMETVKELCPDGL